MKSLELTAEHRVKLLEMCESLFPEQSPFQIGIPQELRKGWGHSKDFVFGKSDVFVDDGIYSHWFEFCHNHLSPKVFGAGRYRERVQFYIDTFGGNPIDYLYEEFKKLKL